MSRATLTQMKQLGLDSYALSQMADDDLQAALDAAMDRIDGIIATQYPPPILTPYPMDLIECECVIGSWVALNARGYRASSDTKDPVYTRYLQWDNYDDKAPGWLQRVAKGEIVPKIVSAAQEATDAGASGPAVITSTQRGYSERGVNIGGPRLINVDPFSGD